MPSSRPSRWRCPRNRKIPACRHRCSSGRISWQVGFDDTDMGELQIVDRSAGRRSWTINGTVRRGGILRRRRERSTAGNDETVAPASFRQASSPDLPDRGRSGAGAVEYRSDHPQGRVRLAHRAVRLRQDDACCASSPTSSSRPAEAILVNGMTPTRRAQQTRLRLCLPGAGALSWRTIERTSRCRWRSWASASAEQQARIKRTSISSTSPASSSRFPWQLSGGMQQRASIARALAFDAAASDGRAVRRARRDRARPSERAAAGALGADARRRSASSPIRSPKRCISRRASW